MAFHNVMKCLYTYSTPERRDFHVSLVYRCHRYDCTRYFIVVFPLMIHQAFWLFSSYSFILGFFAFGWYSLYIISISEQADKHIIGLTISTALTINQFFIIAAPALFGLFVDWSGQFILCFVALAALILILVAWQLLRTIFNKKHVQHNLNASFCLRIF